MEEEGLNPQVINGLMQRIGLDPQSEADQEAFSQAFRRQDRNNSETNRAINAANEIIYKRGEAARTLATNNPDKLLKMAFSSGPKIQAEERMSDDDIANCRNGNKLLKEAFRQQAEQRDAKKGKGR